MTYLLTLVNKVVVNLPVLATKEAREAMTAVIAETTTATSVLQMPTKSVVVITDQNASSCSIFRNLRNVTAKTDQI